MVKKIVLLSILALSLSACGVNHKQGRRALEAQGMTDIHIGSWAIIGCGRDDDFSSYFTAKDANGKEVSGTLCGGWLKGITVRYD